MMRLFTIRVVGCVEPEIHGPYDTDKERLEATRELNDDPGQDAALRLNVDDVGNPEVRAGFEILEIREIKLETAAGPDLYHSFIAKKK